MTSSILDDYHYYFIIIIIFKKLIDLIDWGGWHGGDMRQAINFYDGDQGYHSDLISVIFKTLTPLSLFLSLSIGNQGGATRSAHFQIVSHFFFLFGYKIW